MRLTEPLIEQYKRAKASLLAEYPELVSDPDVVRDTLDGTTEAQDVITKLVKHHLEDKAAAEALKSLEEDYAVRRERLQARSNARKAMALRLMNAIGEKTIVRPEFTLTVSVTRPSVIIIDDELLPEAYVRVKREPDKIKIRTDILAGADIPGAMLDNGSETLIVRTT